MFEVSKLKTPDQCLEYIAKLESLERNYELRIGKVVEPTKEGELARVYFTDNSNGFSRDLYDLLSLEEGKLVGKLASRELFFQNDGDDFPDFPVKGLVFEPFGEVKIDVLPGLHGPRVYELGPSSFYLTELGGNYSSENVLGSLEWFKIFITGIGLYYLKDRVKEVLESLERQIKFAVAEKLQDPRKLVSVGGRII